MERRINGYSGIRQDSADTFGSRGARDPEIYSGGSALSVANCHEDWSLAKSRIVTTLLCTK